MSKKQTSKTEKQVQRPTPARRQFPLAFKLVLPLISLLALVLVEVVLELLGLNSSVRLFERARAPDGTPVYRLNMRVSERFFFRRYQGRPVAPQRALPVEFPVRKPGNTIRIFTLGGSTTAGFPYSRSAAFGGFLRQMLSDLHPERKFEVINCGITALNSYAVLDFMPDILRGQPDLIVVYCAHNEFYGCHGVGSLQALATNRTLIRVFIALQKTCLYQGVDSILRLLPSPRGERTTATLIEAMPRDQEIRRNSRKHAVAEATFRKNMEAIVQLSQRAGVPIVLTTVASNVKDLTPMRSAHREGLSPADLQRWTDLYNQAINQQKIGQFAEAEVGYRKAIEMDGEYAEAYFRMGQCQAKEDRWGFAKLNFLRAIDLDALHFRACPVFNEIIRDIVARAAGGKAPAILADVETALASESYGGVTGYELMTDHLHPNMRGTYLIASAICQALAESKIADRFGPKWDPSRLRSLAQYETVVGYSSVERYLTAQILVGLYERFPFDTQPDRQTRLEQLRADLKKYEAALSSEERRELARTPGKAQNRTFSLYLHLGDSKLQEGDFDKAVVDYREALRQAGQTPAEDCQMAWIGLGTAERKRGHSDEALRAYEEALKIPGRQATVWYNIGRLYQDRHDTPRAEQAYAKALEIEPDDTDSIINLGLIARERKDTETAKKYFERAAATERGRVLGRYHLATLSLARGLTDEAIAHLREGIAANPEHAPSLRLLGYCHLQRVEYDEAEKAFARAIAIDESDAATWYNRAIAAIARSKVDLAFECAQRAVRYGGKTMAREMATDRALAPLRVNPGFQSLIEQGK
jgi:tetratricopeptide (TPR) repeat protein